MVPIIDRHFHELMQPLSEDEFAQLEKNIVEAGECTDPVAVWMERRRDGGGDKGQPLLLDGENRLSICAKHGIPYKTVEIDLPDRMAAYIWIIDNQLGRRNLNKAQRIALAQEKAGILREQAGENRRAGVKVGEGGPVNVRKKIAEIAGVAEQTVEYFMKVQEAADPVALRQVMEGKAKIYTAFRNMNVVKTKVVDVITEEMAEEMNRPLLKGVILGNIGFIRETYLQTLGSPPAGSIADEDFKVNDLINKQGAELRRLTRIAKKREA
jgi:hypothetical protein